MHVNIVYWQPILDPIKYDETLASLVRQVCPLVPIPAPHCKVIELPVLSFAFKTITATPNSNAAVAAAVAGRQRCAGSDSGV